MTQQGAVTPRPWSYALGTKRWHIFDGNGIVITDVATEEIAQRIVACVNKREQLVAALRHAQRRISEMPDVGRTSRDDLLAQLAAACKEEGTL